MADRKIYLSPVFARKLKKLNRLEKSDLDDAVRTLQRDPETGQEKKGDLAGVFVFKGRINKQVLLISYTFTDLELHLLTFGSHENFYRDLKNYKKG